MSRNDHKSSGPSHRQERVGETVRHAISDIFTRREIADRALTRHSLTTSRVEMSPDLKLATVYVTTLGGRETKAALAALDANRRELRQRVAERVNLKFAPDLRFRLDASLDVQSRIDALLSSPEVARDLKPQDPDPTPEDKT